MTFSIIVGVDHSDRSDKAIKRAGLLADEHGGDLTLECVLDVQASNKLRDMLERAAAEETADRAGALLKNASKRRINVTIGRPHQALDKIATERMADLIVLGAHRRDDALPAASGATARRLVNVTTTPVLIADSDPAGPYKNVLVGYDDSVAARQALKMARALAPKAALTTVTASLIPFSSRKNEAGLVRQFEQDTSRMVQEALSRETGGNQSSVNTIVRVGDALGVILDVVDEKKPDLLVLGTSMPELFRQIFGGGIVDMLVTDPPCDLLVVKA